MSVLSEAGREFWEENGYVVIHDAVPQENLTAVTDATWDFLEMDRNDPDDWYREPLSPGGMVEMYQHQALWNNRQYPKVHQAFSEIWETEKLWVSIDRVNFKLPSRADKPEWSHPGFIHWDLDPNEDPIRFRVQGVLYLSDTAEGQGGFQCVPGFHRQFHEWVKTQKRPLDRRPPLDGLEVKSIPGKAGDLLIWHSLLLHGNGHNMSDRIRQAQYFSMSPARDDEAARQRRIRMWRELESPDGKPFPGDPRRWEKRHCTPAELTELGRKLLGSDLWD